MGEIIKNHKKAVIIVGCICLAILIIYASYVHWTNYVTEKETITSLEWVVPLSEEYTRDDYLNKINTIYLGKPRQELEGDLKKINLQLVSVENKQEDSSYDELYGIRNCEGKLIIPSKYEVLKVDIEQKYILTGGSVPKEKEENNDTYKYHYYKLDGTDFIKEDFEHASMFENGYACVKKNGENYVISKNGEKLLKVNCDFLDIFDADKGLFSFANDVDKVYENGNDTHYYSGQFQGIIDIDGQIIVEPKYDYISQITEDRIIAGYKNDRGKDLYVFWNNKFKPISDKVYEELNWSNKGAIAAKYQHNWYIINKDEDVIAKIENCIELYGFSEGIALAQNNKELRYIDTKGNVLFTVPNRYKGYIWSVCKSFTEGKVGFLNKNKKYGYMDKQGKVIVEPIFDKALTVRNGEAFVEIGNKAGVIKFQN